eukprot:347489-Chlamydomonas_euryale.AAC.6
MNLRMYGRGTYKTPAWVWVQRRRASKKHELLGHARDPREFGKARPQQWASHAPVLRTPHIPQQEGTSYAPASLGALENAGRPRMRGAASDNPGALRDNIARKHRNVTLQMPKRVIRNHHNLDWGWPRPQFRKHKSAGDGPVSPVPCTLNPTSRRLASAVSCCTSAAAPSSSAPSSGLGPITTIQACPARCHKCCVMSHCTATRHLHLTPSSRSPRTRSSSAKQLPPLPY